SSPSVSSVSRSSFTSVPLKTNISLSWTLTELSICRLLANACLSDFRKSVSFNTNKKAAPNTQIDSKTISLEVCFLSGFLPQLLQAPRRSRFVPQYGQYIRSPHFIPYNYAYIPIIAMHGINLWFLMI